MVGLGAPPTKGKPAFKAVVIVDEMDVEKSVVGEMEPSRVGRNWEHVQEVGSVSQVEDLWPKEIR